MQQPTFFENEIVQPKNLNFLTDSTAKNIKDVVLAVGGGRPGKVAGLTLSGISGNNYFIVNPGYGFAGDGERVQIYSTGINFGITFTGTQSVYLNYGSSVWNPDPTVNPLGSAGVVTNIDPTDSSLVAVENYNIAEITLTSGANYIPLGTVTADTSMMYVTSSPSGSQNFTIGGIIDINTNTINGINISSGSIDSNIFTSELHYDITLSTGTDILLSASGNNNLGGPANPFSNIYAATGNFHALVGYSPILIDTLQQVTGTSLEGTGTNLVIIDSQAAGTRFGQGLTLNTNSISTVGTNNDINLATDPLKRVNVNSTLNVLAGNNVFIKDNLIVSGTASFGITDITSSTGNFAVGGSLSMRSTDQMYTNIVPNPEFALTTTGGTGVGFAPGAWTITTPNTDYAYGPNLVGPAYVRTSTTGITSWNAQLGTTGNYTIEMNIKVLGNSLFGSPNNLFSKFVTNSSSGPPYNAEGATFTIAANSGLSYSSNSLTSSTPTGTIITNTWHHVAYTWNGTQRKIYVDNVPIVTDSNLGSWIKTPGPGTPTEIRIGAFGSSTNNFNGLINNVRLSNIARTSFPSGSQGPTTTDANTLALWRMDNNLADATAGQYNLLEVGGTAAFTETRLGQVFSGTTNIAANDTLPTGSQSVLYGAPHANTWLTCSGVNIDSTGIFMSAAINAKPNTPYNFSYYAKLLTTGVSNIGIINYVYGTSNTGTYVQNTTSVPVPITSTEWTRVDTSLITPASGSNFNFGVAIRNLNTTGTSDIRFGLASMQATEGPAIVPFESSQRNRVLTIPLPLYKATFTVAPSNPGIQTVYSATINTKGGIAIISAPLTIAMARNSGPNGVDQSYQLSLWVDGVQVGAADTIIPWAVANNMPILSIGGFGVYAWTGNGNLHYMSYLSSGNHTIQIKLFPTANGGGTTTSTYYVYGDRNPLQVMLFE